MKPHRKKRLYAIMAIVFGVGIAVTLMIYALGQNINVYLTPSQVVANPMLTQRVIRMGGMVKSGSVRRDPTDLTVYFTVTDFHHEVAVRYRGILPTLFRAGQGVVVQGKLASRQEFVADQVLAKHDENYMPPEISSSMRQRS